MKKTIALFLVMMLVFITTVAYAAEPITLDVSAVDVQTGKAVNKTYVENELFKLKVDIGIPRFADTADLELKIELDGVELDETDITLTDGTYYLTGIVTAQPAALRVTINDMAYEHAETAAELYDAQQHDRTVTQTYRFYTTNVPAVKEYIIPKTGDLPVMGYAVMAVVAAAACYKKRGD